MCTRYHLFFLSLEFLRKLSTSQQFSFSCRDVKNFSKKNTNTESSHRKYLKVTELSFKYFLQLIPITISGKKYGNLKRRAQKMKQKREVQSMA